MNERRKVLTDYAADWQVNAENDPLYVILCDPRYRDRKWDLQDFFATGEEEIIRVFEFMKSNSIPVSLDTFLDFGCGVGRLSKALRKRFNAGYGIDVSPKMIELARQYVDGVDFLFNDSDNLSCIPDRTVDFIYSHNVLQHIPTQYQEKYIDEFFRILKPGGLAAFQIPTKIVESVGSKEIFFQLRQFLKRLFPVLTLAKRKLSASRIVIEMHPLSNDIVEELCQMRNCSIEFVAATNSIEYQDGKLKFYDKDEHEEKLKYSQKPRPEYLNYMYFIRKSECD